VSLYLKDRTLPAGKATRVWARVEIGAGAVEFRAGGRVLAKANPAGGVATARLTGLAVGRKAITAHYLGDEWAQPASSAAKTLTVKRAAPRSLALKAAGGRVSVKVGRLNNGAQPVGKLTLYTGKTKLASVKLRAKAKGKASFRLPGGDGSIAVRAVFRPANAKKVAPKTSKTINVSR
jgi:hypothetical protein